MKNRKTKPKPRHITRANWDAVNSPPLSEAVLQTMKPSQEILPAAFLKACEEGRVGRPKSPHPKQAVSIRIDQDVLKAFRETGPGWQARINALLRENLPG